ncbi:hypothetical protein CYMTET_5060 [Cymbomonas tetramitiformis]|uniref:Uncharacterized protein n=1 Tax=Cymbomonas tetramitiformis TaxID=36881 RepID=A0AAE0GZX5_9CHLO|nr:hypothetical protein CYMTET_5060 [Cymbomonas tetramitiformis]
MTYDPRMQRSDVEPCLYHIWTTELTVLIPAYVDEYIIATNDKSWYDTVVALLHAKYACKELGVLDLVMGIGVRWGHDAAYLSQTGYTAQMIETYGFQDDSWHPCLCPRGLLCVDPFEFLDTCGKDHFVALKQVVRYPKGTLDYELVRELGRSHQYYILNVLDDIFSIHKQARMCCNDQRAIHLGSDYENNSRSEHIEVRNMYIQEEIKDGNTEPLHTGSSDNTSDIFTKPLPLTAFQVRRESLGIMKLERHHKVTDVISNSIPNQLTLLRRFHHLTNFISNFIPIELDSLRTHPRTIFFCGADYRHRRRSGKRSGQK